MQWQTIETAPKDGTSVLIISADYPDCRAVMGFWEYTEMEGWSWCLYEKLLWHDIPEEHHGLIGWMPEPTHWMPLPAPPTT